MLKIPALKRPADISIVGVLYDIYMTCYVMNLFDKPESELPNHLA